MLLLRVTRSCLAHLYEIQEESDGTWTCVVTTRRLLPGETFTARAEPEGFFTLRSVGLAAVPRGCYKVMRRPEVFAWAWLKSPSVQAVARRMRRLGFYKQGTVRRAWRYAAWLRRREAELGLFPGGVTPSLN